MARPVKQRKILSPYYELSLFPLRVNKLKGDNVIFLTEEYEAIKLIDYEGLKQSQAARFMQISRPTFTRIYKRARIKIATSFVENRYLKLSGGNIYFNDDWYKCQDCGCIYNVVKNAKNNFCPLCKSSNFIKTVKNE
jgi:predicted DNA-binding protein (UPF0251 family)